jgi:uncharacterized damage-inducible protein DinB
VTTLPEPGSTSDIRGLLLDYLDYYRRVVAAKLDGLSEADLTGSRVPSGWTPSGLVNHVVNVERRWLEWGFLGRAIDEPWRDSTEDGGWVTLDLPPDELGRLLEDRAARTREIVEGHDLTEASQLTGRFRDAETAPHLHGILVHLVQEYARHVGHLDIARELIDGETGEDG